MPSLRIQTNLPSDAPGLEQLPAALSPLLAELLGKPESYVQVVVQPGACISFGGEATAPSAFAALSSIGLKEELTKPLSRTICNALERTAKIPPDRVFIEFTDAPRAMFGWNRDTFA